MLRMLRIPTPLRPLIRLSSPWLFASSSSSSVLSYCFGNGAIPLVYSRRSMTNSAGSVGGGTAMGQSRSANTAAPMLPASPSPPPTPSSPSDTSLAFYEESLHYAMDAEFLKCDGAIMVRSIAFVPFITADRVDEGVVQRYHFAQQQQQLASPSAAVGSAAEDTPPPQQRGATLMGSHRHPSVKAKGAAAQALLAARLKKEQQQSQHNTGSTSTAPPSNPSPPPSPPPPSFRPITLDPSRSTVGAPQRGVGAGVGGPSAAPSLSADGCKAASLAKRHVVVRVPPQAFTPQTVVVAMRHDVALAMSDLLPCGHAVDAVCMRHMPRSYYTDVLPYGGGGGRRGGGGDDTAKAGAAGPRGGGRFLGRVSKMAAIPEAPKGFGQQQHQQPSTPSSPSPSPSPSPPTPMNAPYTVATCPLVADKHKRLSMRLDPYNVPNVAKHELLLRRLYRAAVAHEEGERRRAEGASLAAATTTTTETGVAVPFFDYSYAPRVDADRGGGMMVFRRILEDDADEEEAILERTRKGRGQPQEGSGMDGGASLADKVNAVESFDAVLRELLLILMPVTTSRGKSVAKNKGRSFPHDVKYYGPLFLRNYFASEDIFIQFLWDCYGAAADAMKSSELRYTTDVTLRSPWGLLTGAAMVAEGTRASSVALPRGWREDRLAALDRAEEAGTNGVCENDGVGRDAAGAERDDEDGERVRQWSPPSVSSSHPAPSSPLLSSKGSAATSRSSRAPPMANVYIMCDSVDEFAVATSALWERLIRLEEGVRGVVKVGRQRALAEAFGWTAVAEGSSSSAPVGSDAVKGIEGLSAATAGGGARPLSAPASIGHAHATSSSTVRRPIPSKSLADALSLSMPDGDGGGKGRGTSSFYSYGAGDAPPVRATVARVRDMGPDTIHRIAAKLNLPAVLDEVYPLPAPLTPPTAAPLTSPPLMGASSAHRPHSPSSPSSVALLASPYVVAIKDITMHSLFNACGLPHAGHKVPKLVDALRLVSGQSAEGRALLQASETDNHNPLWDAAALGAICTFVLRMRRS